jgi:hypothetical protein
MRPAPLKMNVTFQKTGIQGHCCEKIITNPKSSLILPAGALQVIAIQNAYSKMWWASYIHAVSKLRTSGSLVFSIFIILMFSSPPNRSDESSSHGGDPAVMLAM